MTVVFWVSLGTLAYIYAGYPLLAWALARVFGREPRCADITPTVSLLIPAYNEEAHIAAKLENSLRLDYPRDRLEIVVASDGSTDRTNALVKRFQPRGVHPPTKDLGGGVKLIALRDHVGKSTLLSRTVPLLQGEIVVFSDASSELEPQALRRLVRPFADPRVGCVSGTYRLRRADDLRGQGEGLYWRYETFLKRQESRLHSILGAHGACYAIRRALFQRLDASSINDDYLIPMRIVEHGLRAVYEPSAVSWEREAASMRGEFARRRRIAVGNCQQIIALRRLLNPFTPTPNSLVWGCTAGWVALSFVSHKVLRTFAPVFMVTLFVSSCWLAQPWRAATVSAQLIFYASALVGYGFQRRGRSVKWLALPLYFCLGNLSMLAGIVRFCLNPKRPAWERAR